MLRATTPFVQRSKSIKVNVRYTKANPTNVSAVVLALTDYALILIGTFYPAPGVDERLLLVKRVHRERRRKDGKYFVVSDPGQSRLARARRLNLARAISSPSSPRWPCAIINRFDHFINPFDHYINACHQESLYNLLSRKRTSGLRQRILSKRGRVRMREAIKR